jgi:pSer/pThr/pTyr-binding forkhead associated (FHA) protein
VGLVGLMLKSMSNKNSSSKAPNRFRAKVACIVGPQKGLALFLVEGEYVLGREPPAHFVVAEPSISRRHLKFVVGDKKVDVFDLGSGNGSYVNNMKIQQVQLSHGDRLKVGESEFIFTISSENQSVEKVANPKSQRTQNMSTPLTSEETTQRHSASRQPLRKWRSLAFFIVLGGLIGLAAAQWFEYQKENAKILLERNKLGDLYDAVMAASSGNYGYADAKIDMMEKQLRHNFLYEQAKEFVVFSAEFEKAEILAGQGHLGKAIETLRNLDLSGVWQEPLSSLKQKKNKRLQAWERQYFLELQEDFVRALEQGDKEKAKQLLEQLGASSIQGGNLSPMKAQLESLLTRSDEATPIRDDPVDKAANAVPRKAKEYYSESKSQESFSEAIELFRSGEDRQACKNLKQLVRRARTQSIWQEKAQSFISRKCSR